MPAKRLPMVNYSGNDVKSLCEGKSRHVPFYGMHTTYREHTKSIRARIHKILKRILLLPPFSSPPLRDPVVDPIHPRPSNGLPHPPQRGQPREHDAQRTSPTLNVAKQVQRLGQQRGVVCDLRGAQRAHRELVDDAVDVVEGVEDAALHLVAVVVVAVRDITLHNALESAGGVGHEQGQVADKVLAP